jgi:serine phosphatase RsbU (regulator of sigma subunit)
VQSETISGMEQARVISRLLQSEERLTAALVDSQDRLAALLALIEVRVDSLDDNRALSAMLEEALELTDSDGAVLTRGDGTILVGSHPSTAELRTCMATQTNPTHGPRTIDIAGAAAVVAVLGDAESPATLGLIRRSGRHYSTGDLQLIDAIMSATDKLLMLTRLHRLAMQRAAVDREHQVASSLAQAVLPVQPPVMNGIDVFAETIPANLAGGDFYVFEVRDGVLWFAVGDVAGKGLPAAIVMTRAVSAARVAFHTHPADDAAGALAAVGDELFDYLHAVGLFVTMALGSYCPGSGVLHLCNAGHSPILSLAGRRKTAVPPSTPPIGVIPGAKGRTQAIPFEFGSILVLGSDGLTEQEDPDGRLYGYERFEEKVVELSHLPLRTMGARLMRDIARHASGTPASDDCTLVLLRGIA